jgi:hypothetical protein
VALRAGFVIEQAEYSNDGIFAKYVLRRDQERQADFRTRTSAAGRPTSAAELSLTSLDADRTTGGRVTTGTLQVEPVTRPTGEPTGQ